MSARFAELVQQPSDDHIPLDETALLLAAAADPSTDVAGGVAAIDDLAERCPGSTFDDLRRHLFVTEGFRGDTDDYYDPANSFLDKVIARRRGIPITLSVLAIEVGRRLGLRIEGIGMPGHFLARHGDTVFDPFYGGEVLDRAACEQRFLALAGAGARFDDAMLAPAGKREILARMLANLKRIYTEDGDLLALEHVLRLRTAIPGTPDEERHQLTRLRARWN